MSPRPGALTDRERLARGMAERCDYGPLGNRTTCLCGHCVGWRHRLAQRQGRARRPARATPPGIDRAVKAAIVDRMFTAAYGQLRQTTRILSAEYGVKASTIQTGWRRWARARDAVSQSPAPQSTEPRDR